MAISAPGPLRMTTQNRPLPNVVTVALTAPGPVKVAASGAGDGGSTPVIASTSRAGYYGYSYLPTVGAGQQASLANGSIVDGFAGCTQGSEVFIASDGTLTHTAATTSVTETVDSDAGVVAIPDQRPIGIALSTTKIYFYAI